MPQQTINIGSAPDDGTGDTLRDGGDKINDNFDELYDETLKLKGSTDCSANPNYPAALKGDSYRVSVAGKIGGASGVDVEAEDRYYALADNAGGTQAGVGSSWSVLQGNTTAGSVISELDDVPDVNAPSPSNGDVLTWDSTPGEWVAQTPSAGITELDDVPDVNAPSPSNGDVLTWDSTPGEWVAQAPSSGSAGYEAGPPGTVPLMSALTWVNMDTSTGTDGTDALIIKADVNGEFHSLVQNAPSTPYDVYCRVDFDSLSTAAVTTGIDFVAGIALRDSSDGEMIFFMSGWTRVSGDEQNAYYVALYQSAAGVTIGTSVFQKFSGKATKWLRVNNDGTTLTFYFSADGKNWHQAGTQLLSTFIDTANQYGAGVLASANATECWARFSYLDTTAPA